MKRPVAAFALCALAACSDVGSSTDSVIAIQVTPPPGNLVEVGDTVQYTAVTLNQNGDPIPAPVLWATPDTQNISLDSLTGIVVGRRGGTQAKVQASSQGLVAAPNVLNVLATADTLILVPPDTVRVDLLPATTSPPLVARLESLRSGRPAGWPRARLRGDRPGVRAADRPDRRTPEWPVGGHGDHRGHG